jgi:hypothetical protein
MTEPFALDDFDRPESRRRTFTQADDDIQSSLPKMRRTRSRPPIEIE